MGREGKSKYDGALDRRGEERKKDAEPKRINENNRRIIWEEFFKAIYK